MKCLHVQQQLTNYLERMCNKSEITDIARHIEACSDCAQQLMELQRVKSSLQRISHVDPGPYIFSEMMATIRERTTHAALAPKLIRRKPTNKTRYIAVAAATILTAVSMSWYLWSTPQDNIVQSPSKSDDITIYLQEHALQTDQGVFSNGAIGSVMIK